LIFLLLKQLHANVKQFKKDDILILTGAQIETIGIVLDGSIEISRIDYAGNRLIINQIEYPAMFGEALACANIDISPVTLTALTNSEVLMLDFNRFVREGPQGCENHHLIVSNMLGILANKNLFLQQRLELLSKRTMRAKLCTYLFRMLATSNNDNTIHIPYNRLALADYLGVNRSAMSKELSKMRDEGLIDYKKNIFVLLDPAKISALANQFC
jgi:CRP-like cAMP-binding protein